LLSVNIDDAKRRGPGSCWVTRLRACASQPQRGWSISIWPAWARPIAPCRRDRFEFRARA